MQQIFNPCFQKAAGATCEGPCLLHDGTDGGHGADGGSPRSCVTSVAGRAPRLPKWASGLEALQSPQLQALAQQWQQQQAHLSSVHLHPHEVRCSILEMHAQVILRGATSLITSVG